MPEKFSRKREALYNALPQRCTQLRSGSTLRYDPNIPI